MARRGRTPARLPKKGCADSQRTTQMMAVTVVVVGLLVGLMLLAWWQGFVEIDDGTPDTSSVPGTRNPAANPASQSKQVVRLAPSVSVERLRAPEKQDQVVAAAFSNLPATPVNTRERTVILSDAGGMINTGVWPAWGSQPPDEADLQWAGAGVHIHKPCPYRCQFRHGNHVGAKADAVIMETVNHPKFGHAQEAFAWPEAADAKVFGAFYMEPEGMYPMYDMTDATMKERVDVSITYQPDADVPVSLMCPWGVKPASPEAAEAFGEQAAAYLHPFPASAKRTDGGVALFSDRGVESLTSRRLLALASALGDSLHAYRAPGGIKQTPLPPGAEDALSHLPARLELIRSYRVVLVAQSALNANWVEPELSHALVAGAVPVVWGASNLRELMPSDDAFVDATAYQDDTQALLQRIQQLLYDDAEYDKAQAWRTQVLADLKSATRSSAGSILLAKRGPAGRFNQFADRLASKCVHYAECRICERVVAATQD